MNEPHAHIESLIVDIDFDIKEKIRAKSLLEREINVLQDKYYELKHALDKQKEADKQREHERNRIHNDTDRRHQPTRRGNELRDD